MAQSTINEGLAWLKPLKKRHEELLSLCNDNAHRQRRFYGASADKEFVKESVYDVKVLDQTRDACGARGSAARAGPQDDERGTTIEGYTRMTPRSANCPETTTVVGKVRGARDLVGLGLSPL